MGWREPADVAELYEFARSAMQELYCWFGSPVDSDWETLILEGRSDGIIRVNSQSRYVVFLADRSGNWWHRRWTIAHEMYHRAVYLRGGLRTQAWVDEVVGVAASARVMRALGHGEYADGLLKQYCGASKPMSRAALGRVRRTRLLVSLIRPGYPPGFASAVANLSLRIESLVGWPDLCRIVDCDTWEEWLAGIPTAKRDLAKHLVLP